MIRGGVALVFTVTASRPGPTRNPVARRFTLEKVTEARARGSPLV